MEGLIKDNILLKSELETVQESLSDLTLRIDEIGWTSLGVTGDEWDLDCVNRASKPLNEMSESNVLIKRAIQLRTAYVYGDGVKIQVNSRIRKIIDSQVNRDSFFGPQAQMRRIRARAATGNLFYLVNTTTNQIIHVPVAQITEIMQDTMDTSRLLFVKREWASSASRQESRWFRVSSNTDQLRLPASFDAKGATLDKNWVCVHRAYNAPEGSPLGVPDALSAMRWAEGYSEYLDNQAKLVRAYSRIAGKVTRKNNTTSHEVAAQVRSAQETGSVGNIAVGDFSVLPATGSQVDFNTGRPMASMVAAGLGVGVDALLSGTVGATKSVSDLLDLATSSLMKLLQQDEVEVTKMILEVIGSKNFEVDFPTMDTDPMYRRVQSAAQGTAQGALYRSEFRDLLLDWMNLPNPKDGLPEADGFNAWSDPKSNEEKSDPIARQGNSGVVGAGVGSNNDARDSGEYDR